LGYWRGEEKTRRAFVQVGGKNATYHIRVIASVGPHPDKSLVYSGRFDDQIKVLGHRIELSELEAAVRQLSN
jgi:non-ribosomal peptide synthetase component F